MLTFKNKKRDKAEIEAYPF